MLEGPHHAKTCLLAYADSEDPDQTAHPRSLISGPSLSANRIIGYKMYKMENKGPDDTLGMRRMI